MHSTREAQDCKSGCCVAFACLPLCSGGATGQGLADRAYHPDEIREAGGRLEIDIDYYLGQQVSSASQATPIVVLLPFGTQSLRFAKEPVDPWVEHTDQALSSGYTCIVYPQVHPVVSRLVALNQCTSCHGCRCYSSH
jgi:hypothetical protein